MSRMGSSAEKPLPVSSIQYFLCTVVQFASAAQIMRWRDRDQDQDAVGISTCVRHKIYYSVSKKNFSPL